MADNVKTYILAFNYAEARSFIRKNPGNYVILSRPEQLMGLINPDVVILPNAYRREDFTDLIDMINTRKR